MSDSWTNFVNTAKKYSINIPIKTFDYSINISLQYHYLFAETPKVACSTIKTILQKMELDNSELSRDSFEDIHDRNFSPLLKPSQITPLEYFMEGDHLFKFCFVRNPYTRLLSAYLDKITRDKPEKRFILNSLNLDPDNLKQHISFNEFIFAISKQEIEQMNPHWCIQYYQTFQDKLNYNYIGKIENFDHDIEKILKEINPENYQNYISVEKRHATNATQLLKQFYTKQLKQQVQEIYKEDFIHFEYDFE